MSVIFFIVDGLAGRDAAASAVVALSLSSLDIPLIVALITAIIPSLASSAAFVLFASSNAIADDNS